MANRLLGELFRARSSYISFIFFILFTFLPHRTETAHVVWTAGIIPIGVL